MKPCMFHNRRVVFKTVGAAVVLHNLVVVSRPNGYQSKLWRFAEKP